MASNGWGAPSYRAVEFTIALFDMGRIARARQSDLQ